MSRDHQLPAGRTLVVGLGNPGSRYDGTRHNIGFMVLAELARRMGVSIREERFRALTAEGQLAGRTTTLLAPMTFMNLSGESVQLASHYYRLGLDSIVVLHDDIDLPAGQIKLKVGGGHGGHNGLRSCDQQLGSRDYLRVRLGVGRPPVPAANVSAWVLGRFGSCEAAIVEHLVDRGADAVEMVMRDGLLATQGHFHPMLPPPG